MEFVWQKRGAGEVWVRRSINVMYLRIHEVSRGRAGQCWDCDRAEPGDAAAYTVRLYDLTPNRHTCEHATCEVSKEVDNMPTIRIDDEVFAVLQKRAQAFVDSPNDVLRRDYGLNGHAGRVIPAVQDAPRFPTRQRLHAVPNRRRVMGPILRGEKTPESEYVIPILQALVDAGGRGRRRDIVDRVGLIMKGRLNAYDHRTLSGGQIRWRNTAEWCRNAMVHPENDRAGWMATVTTPLLNPDSGHGWWEITDAGREYLKSNN